MNGTDLGKCTHQCVETQGNSTTKALSFVVVVVVVVAVIAVIVVVGWWWWWWWWWWFSSGVKRETDNTRGMNEYVFILSIFVHQLLLVCTLLCFLLLFVVCLSSYTRIRPFFVVVESAYVLLFPCVSSQWCAYFPRSVLFCQPHQQLFIHFF